MLRLDLYDYSDAYIFVKGTITVEGTNANNQTNKKLIFKNDASLRLCISKINCGVIENVEDVDIVMRMYNLLNLLEYSAITLRHQEVCRIIIEMK